jgi:hypothetical protein
MNINDNRERESESEFVHFTSNNPQTEEEDSDEKSSRKFFESSKEIDFLVSSDCA